MQNPIEPKEMLSQIHDFKTIQSEIRMTRPGWYGPGQEPQVMEPTQSSERIKRKKRGAHPSCDASTEIIDTAAPYFEGSVYSLENVVIDGRIVTAKPWAKAEFTVRIAELVGLLEKDRVNFFLQYLKGDHRADIGC